MLPTRFAAGIKIGIALIVSGCKSLREHVMTRLMYCALVIDYKRALADVYMDRYIYEDLLLRRSKWVATWSRRLWKQCEMYHYSFPGAVRRYENVLKEIRLLQAFEVRLRYVNKRAPGLADERLSWLFEQLVAAWAQESALRPKIAERDVPLRLQRKHDMYFPV